MLGHLGARLHFSSPFSRGRQHAREIWPMTLPSALLGTVPHCPSVSRALYEKTPERKWPVVTGKAHPSPLSGLVACDWCSAVLASEDGSPRGRWVLVCCVIPECCFHYKPKQVDSRWADSDDSWAEEQEQEWTTSEIGTARQIIRTEDKSLEITSEARKVEAKSYSVLQIGVFLYWHSTVAECHQGGSMFYECSSRTGSKRPAPGPCTCPRHGTWLHYTSSLTRQCHTICRHPAEQPWRTF